jgi:hypothetical protein
MSTQYVNQSIAVSIYLDNFLICQEANGVFKENTCADNMKLTLQKIAQAVIKLKDICDN